MSDPVGDFFKAQRPPVRQPPSPPKRTVTFPQALATFAWAVPMLALRGVVLSKLWEWFVSDTFPHIRSISVGEAVGLLVIVGFLTPSDDEPMPVGTAVTRGLAGILVSWGIGIAVVSVIR